MGRNNSNVGYEYMNATKSELVNILYNLQSHWNVLEEEVVEINKDINHMRECLAKYGEHFRIPLEYLKDLKREKKEVMKKIIENMEHFEAHVQGGRSLVQELNRQKMELRQGGNMYRTDASSREQFRRTPTDVLTTGNDTVFVTTSLNAPAQHYKLITKNPLPYETRSRYSKTINALSKEQSNVTGQ